MDLRNRRAWRQPALTDLTSFSIASAPSLPRPPAPPMPTRPSERASLVGRAPAAVGQRYRRGLHLRVRSIAKQEAIFARRDVPIVVRRLISRKQARIDCDLDPLRPAGLQIGFGEGAQALRRFPTRLRPVGWRDIDLADALSGALADIPDREAHLD